MTPRLAIGSLVLLAAVLGCRNQAASPTTSPSTQEAAARPTDQWLGRWNGPEGTYLQISKDTGKYILEIRDLDGSREFAGSADGSRLAFTRDGKEEFISAGDGRATGMKWLSEKRIACSPSRAKAGATTDSYRSDGLRSAIPHIR